MTLTNFYDIMVAIIGTPTNDYESFILYTISAILGMFIILFVFQLFMLITNIFKPRQK
jgi:hypothetical protein